MLAEIPSWSATVSWRCGRQIFFGTDVIHYTLPVPYKKFELMLTIRTKAYSSSCSQTVFVVIGIMPHAYLQLFSRDRIKVWHLVMEVGVSSPQTQKIIPKSVSEGKTKCRPIFLQMDTKLLNCLMFSFNADFASQ